MPKVFYTERDIEDLARQGVTSLAITDSVVVTDLAREKARKLGIQLLTERDSRLANPAAQPAVPAAPPPATPAARQAPSSGADLEARVYNAVKGKLDAQVDDALLRTIVKRVLKSLGRG
ncbi:MAG TPA: hypothetical protein VI688_08005 [Anaerolineales bacterium]|nr:hypothetical protein [Anaerolineales bacterium]